MKRVSLLFIFVLISLFSGCGVGGDSTASRQNTASSVATEEAATTEVADAMVANASYSSTNANTAGAAPIRASGKRNATIATSISLNKAEESYAFDRKIIRNAELNLEAEDPEEAQRKITAVAELRGGFVVESQQSSSEITAKSRDIVSMTVRVPSAIFSEALADIRNTSTRVVMETVKGQDVTEEFIDIEAQMKAKKALEQQFMEIMKRAYSVEDALDVQSQLADVRGEIERIEGRKRFLENQSSMSTIKVRLQTAKVFAATSVGISGRLGQSFSAGADVALNFVLGLVTFVVAVLPFALFIGLPVFALIRYVLKRQSRPRTVAELAEEELKST